MKSRITIIKCSKVSCQLNHGSLETICGKKRAMQTTKFLNNRSRFIDLVQQTISCPCLIDNQFRAENVNKDDRRHVIRQAQAALKITQDKLGHDTITFTYKPLEAKRTWLQGFHTQKQAASHFIIQDFQMKDATQLNCKGGKSRFIQQPCCKLQNLVQLSSDGRLEAMCSTFYRFISTERWVNLE